MVYNVFHVADNGPGIEPGRQEEIFQVFRRGQSHTHSGVEGKGVGLTVVKTVASNYDGRAWVESEPGRGSTFYVSFSVQGTEVSREMQRPDDEESGDVPVSSGTARE